MLLQKTATWGQRPLRRIPAQEGGRFTLFHPPLDPTSSTLALSFTPNTASEEKRSLQASDHAVAQLTRAEPLVCVQLWARH